MEKQKLVHLDLKGAPPKLAYLSNFFPFIKSIGVAGILLEWEDTFPYTNDLIQIGSLGASSASEGHYTQQEALEIIKLAKQSELSVIPLVPTFGHMEFVLKHNEFKHLREDSLSPSCLCPIREGSLSLVKSLVDQIVSFHVGTEYIHIGGDEVWQLGGCDICLAKVLTLQHGFHSLWLDHIISLAEYIKNTYPSLKIIVWDDMLRNISEDILQACNIGSLIEPMVWYYQTSDDFFNPNLWNKYCNVFSNIWAASAFKGATGSRQIMPTIAHHIRNQECWVNGLQRYLDKIRNLQGIVITGWTRYDHYAALCEVLPCGIPSLFFCIKTLQCGRYYPDYAESEANRLGYKFPKHPSVDAAQPPLIPLNFPGSNFYSTMELLNILLKKYKIEIIDDERFNTWMTRWHVHTKYTNPAHVFTIKITVEL